MFQITIDCISTSPMTQFWAAAVQYQVEPPPAGFATWNDYWRSIGVGENDLDPHGDGSDSLIDPTGRGPRIWFQEVPEPKSTKNRIHFDIGVGGGRDVPLQTRKERVDAEVDRLVQLGATRLRETPNEGIDHYGIAMHDPEGNEFDVN